MMISIHRATGLRISSRFPGNSNSITLQVMTDDGETPHEITIYGLPEEATTKLEALADNNTRHHTD